MPFCSNCGNELNEETKFCPKCGTAVNENNESPNQQSNINSGINCPKCGSLIPLGSATCLQCGTPLNEEKHTAAIVIGYITAIFVPIVGIIMGIYLLTRKNRDVHTHGIIMIVLAIVFVIVEWLLFSYLSYVSSMRYYRHYYY